MERNLLVVVTSVCAYLFNAAVGDNPNIGWNAPAWNGTNQWPYNNNAYMKQNNTSLYYPHHSQDRNTTSYWPPTEVPDPILLYAKVFDDGYNFIWGHRVKNDKILYYDKEITLRYENKLRVREIYYPHGRRRPAGTISCIRVIGLRTLLTSWGGHAEVINGGVGHSNVTIRFTPQGTKGYHFNVYIYGVPFPDYDPFWHRRNIKRPHATFSKDNPIHIKIDGNMTIYE